MADLIPIHAVLSGTTIKAYIRTSDVYGESGGIGAKVAIKKVKPEDVTGAEEILPVKEAMRSGLISRIGIRYKNSGGKRKSAKLLCANSQIGKIFGDTKADTLDGVEYKVGTNSKGNILSTNNLRRAYSY